MLLPLHRWAGRLPSSHPQHPSINNMEMGEASRTYLLLHGHPLEVTLVGGHQLYWMVWAPPRPDQCSPMLPPLSSPHPPEYCLHRSAKVPHVAVNNNVATTNPRFHPLKLEWPQAVKVSYPPAKKGPPPNTITPTVLIWATYSHPPLSATMELKISHLLSESHTTPINNNNNSSNNAHRPHPNNKHQATPTHPRHRQASRYHPLGGESSSGYPLEREVALPRATHRASAQPPTQSPRATIATSNLGPYTIIITRQ